MKKKRPAHIKNISELKRYKGFSYPGSKEKMSRGIRFSDHFGLQRLGIWHELVRPGERTSWPHTHSREEEFVYVVKGRPHVWVDGEVFALRQGDAVGIPAGTGIAHVFFNDTKSNVELLVVGESKVKGDKIFYPLHAKRNEEMRQKGFLWKPAKYSLRGSHDGMPKKLRESKIR